MRQLLVGEPELGVRQGPQVRDRLEQARVEHFRAIGSIESLNGDVLVRLAQLDVVDRPAVHRAPVDAHLGGARRQGS